ncbi:MAG: alpha/beta fold hydrolase [Lautropia sp.]
MHYRFGPCELDGGIRELRVDGVARPIEPQVFDLLCHLIAHRARVVAPDELIEVVWKRRIVSDAAIASRISAARAAIGDDGRRQAWIRTVPRRGFRFVGKVVAADAPAPVAVADDARPAAGHRQRIGYCRSADGTRIAFATSGSGYPLIKAGHWLTHLEHDWQSPIWRPLLNRLNARFELIRYDQRGNGLSDWDVAELSLARGVEDLEAVAAAAGRERFALYGSSQGAPIAVAFAARHPQQVSHLVLHGGYECGRLMRPDAVEREQAEALLTLIRHGWGRRGSAFLNAFSTLFIPTGSRAQLDSLVELQRLTTSPENAARLRAAVDRFDVSGLLEQLRVPTLVIHARDDAVQPLDQGMQLASRIPNAEFVLLDSPNHVILEQEPAWATLHDALDRFLPAAAPSRAPVGAAATPTGA